MIAQEAEKHARSRSACARERQDPGCACGDLSVGYIAIFHEWPFGSACEISPLRHNDFEDAQTLARRSLRQRWQPKCVIRWRRLWSRRGVIDSCEGFCNWSGKQSDCGFTAQTTRLQDEKTMRIHISFNGNRYLALTLCAIIRTFGASATRRRAGQRYLFSEITRNCGDR